MSKSTFLPISIILILNLRLVVFATNSFTKTCFAPDGKPSGDGFLPCIMTGNIGSNPTWQSPNCLPKDTCTNTSTGGLASIYVGMTQCSNGSWCCGPDNFTHCCTPELGFHLKNNLVTFGAPNETSDACVVSPVVTLTATATATATITIKSKDGHKIAGVVFGFTFLTIFGSFGGFYVGLMRGQRKGGNRIDMDETCKDEECKPPTVGAHEAHGVAVSELGDNSVRKPK